MDKMPLILLPGTLCDATLFDYQLKHLADFTQAQVIDVHLQDNLADVAQYVLSQVEGKFAVAGLSYGGIVAFEVWRQAPERILKLALLNTNPYPASEQTIKSQLRFITTAKSITLRKLAIQYLERVILHPNPQKDKVLREKVLDMANTIGVEGFINELRAQLYRLSAITDLPHINCPTLVLTGREDLIVPLFAHEQMAETLPNSHLVIIEGCGHLSTIEQPEMVTQALRNWLTDTTVWE